MSDDQQNTTLSAIPLEALYRLLEPVTVPSSAPRASFINWGLSYQCTPLAVFEPETEYQCELVLELARREGKTVRAVGVGHSPSDLACTSQYMLRTEKLNKILEVSVNSRVIHVPISIAPCIACWESPSSRSQSVENTNYFMQAHYTLRPFANFCAAELKSQVAGYRVLTFHSLGQCGKAVCGRTGRHYPQCDPCGACVPQSCDDQCRFDFGPDISGRCDNCDTRNWHEPQSHLDARSVSHSLACRWVPCTLLPRPTRRTLRRVALRPRQHRSYHANTTRSHASFPPEGNSRVGPVR